MAAIYLTEDDVAALVDMPTAIQVVEDVFRSLSAGRADNAPRARVAAEGMVLHSMAAAVDDLELAGWKIYTTTRGAARFLVGLHERSTGALAALIEANVLGQMRTAATSAVAVQWLARADAGELGLFGSGWQAAGQLEAVSHVRKIETAFVYSRHAERRAEFCTRMGRLLGIEVTAVDRPAEAAADLPIVITATTAREPVFDGADLAEGTLVCAIGANWWNRAEIDAHVVRRADNIICDSVAACRGEAGDFRDALERGIFDWSRAVDLAEVVTGRATGRNRRESVVLFKSVGMAVEDVAVGAEVLRRARRQGRGVELPF